MEPPEWSPQLIAARRSSIGLLLATATGRRRRATQWADLSSRSPPPTVFRAQVRAGRSLGATRARPFPASFNYALGLGLRREKLMRAL